MNEIVISFYVGVNFCYSRSQTTLVTVPCAGDTLITHNTAAIFSVIMNGNITLHYNNARRPVGPRKAFARAILISLAE